MKQVVVRVVSMLLFLTLYLPSMLYAATITSTAAGGTWTSTSTWTGGVVPAAGDAVVIATTGSGSVTVAANLSQTSAGTVTVNNGGSLNVTGGTAIFGSLSILDGGIATFYQNLTVLDVSNISGTINFGSSNTTVRTMTFTGAVTLNNTANWNETSTGAIPKFLFSSNFINNAAVFTALSGLHTFNGRDMSFSGSQVTAIANVTIASPGIYTNTGILTVATALAGNGSLFNGATGTLNLGGTNTVGAFDAMTPGNTVNYFGGAQTCRIATYSNLTLSGSLAKTFATTPIVNGILSMEGTAIIAVTQGAVTLVSIKIC